MFMLEKINKLLGIKTCEHKWVYEAVGYDFYFYWRRRNIKKSIVELLTKPTAGNRQKEMQFFKKQNPEYYVIGVED